MFLRKQLQKTLLVGFIVWTMLLSAIPVKAQDIVAVSSITGGSSVFVFRKARNSNQNSFAGRKSSKAKRTRSQRKATVRKVVTSSRAVAKSNRNRRDIDKVTPQAFAQIEIKRKSPEEASKIFAGLAEYYLELEDDDKAVLAYEEAVKLDDNNKDAKLGLSEVYTRMGDEALETDEFEKAKRYYDEAIRLDDKNSSAYAGRGQYFDQSDKDEEAKAEYLKALSIDPEMTQVKAPLGILFFQEGELAKSDEYLNAALKGGEENAETQYFLGLIRYKQGRDAEAETALRKSISIDDTNEDAHYYLGAVLNRLGRANDAITEFVKSTKIDEQYVLAWFDLGVAYFNQQKYDDSISAFKQAIKFNTNRTDELKKIYEESYANLAESYRQKGDLDQAITNYGIATARITNDSDLYTNYGFVLGQKNKWKPAIDNFEKAAKEQPDAISYANLGWAHFQQALYDGEYNQPKSRIDASLREAKAALVKSVSLDANFAAALLNLGVVLNDLGEHQEAEKALEKADGLDKNWLPAMSELGIAYLRQGKYDKSAKQFKKVLDKDKGNIWALYYLSESQFRDGKMDDARKTQKDVRKLNPKLADRLETMFRSART